MEASSREEECVGRRTVKPLRIIDETEQRALGRSFRKQAQERQCGQESVVCPVEGHPERASKGRGLRLRKAVDKTEVRPHQLMHRREWDLGLRLDAGAAKDIHSPRLAFCKCQQCGLADARLTPNDEDAACAIAGVRQQRSDSLPLDLTSDDHSDDCPALPAIWLGLELGRRPIRADATPPTVRAMNPDRRLVLALQMAGSHSPLAVELDIGPQVIPLPLEAAICFLVLESIANVAEHAHATNLKIKVWVEDQRVVTEVEDNGVGGATGLRKLRERARAVGGTIEVDSPPGVGTLIRAEVPFATQR